MDQILKDNKQAIRALLALIPDQRLAEIYAFNWDGKMKYNSCCACLVGVISAAQLHRDRGVAAEFDYCPEGVLPNEVGGVAAAHYLLAKQNCHTSMIDRAESAYRDLVWPSRLIRFVYSAFCTCPCQECRNAGVQDDVDTQYGLATMRDIPRTNALRRLRFSPIVRAELRRRDRAKAANLYQRKRHDTAALKSHAELVSG